MAKSKAVVNQHVKKYVEAVFEKRLREEGFICPDEKYICWYRVVNDELINSIVFFSSWNALPVILEIGYGIYPLFEKPIYTTSVYSSNLPFNPDVFTRQYLAENYPINNMRYTSYSEDIQVYAPGRDGKGIYTFDSIILPKMNSVTNMQECYRMHKQDRLGGKGEDMSLNSKLLSGVFVDEAIYYDDAELYPYCIDYAESSSDRYRSLSQLVPNNKEYPIELCKWELRKDVLINGKREEYLTILEKRKKEIITYLKKLGIDIS